MTGRDDHREPILAAGSTRTPPRRTDLCASLAAATRPGCPSPTTTKAAAAAAPTSGRSPGLRAAGPGVCLAPLTWPYPLSRRGCSCVPLPLSAQVKQMPPDKALPPFSVSPRHPREGGVGVGSGPRLKKTGTPQQQQLDSLPSLDQIAGDPGPSAENTS